MQWFRSHQVDLESSSVESSSVKTRLNWIRITQT